MSKYLGLTVKIDGTNKPIRECMLCHKKLNQREYLESSGYCQPCRKRRYNAGKNAGKNILGENRVDEVLIRKLGGGKRK